VTLTPYNVGDRVVNVGNVYRASAAGTSGAGTGPTGTDTTAPITDGTVTWFFLGLAGGAVTDVAPELFTTPAAQEGALLDMVDREVDECGWGDRADDGRRYLAAHLATLGKRKGLGPLTAESLGQASRSYASMLQFGALGLTTYGVEYQRRARLLPSVLGEVF
jgi:hypothetical protein